MKKQSLIKSIDNTGTKTIQIINFFKKTELGYYFKGVIKSVTKKRFIKKSELVHGLILQKKLIRVNTNFNQNACILIDKNTFNLVGSRIIRPVFIRKKNII